MKKPPNFIMDFKSSYKVLVYYKFLWSENLRQRNNGPFKKFLKSARKCVLAVLKKYEILASNDTLKMYCCSLHYWKLKLYKQALSKIRTIKYSVSIFFKNLLLFSRGFCQKFYEKIVLFYCKFCKFISASTTTQNFKILIFILLKLQRLTYNTKF